MTQWTIPLAALIVAMGGLLYTSLAVRNGVSSEYVRSLEARIERLERDLNNAEKRVETAEQKLTDLRDENVDLLRQLFKATGGRRHIPEAADS